MEKQITEQPATDPIDAFHEKIAARLREARDDARARARDARREAEEAEEEAREIEEAVKAEKWYELGGYLTSAEIDSLCDISPQDLLANPDW
jgi:hypothetical protein